ncbi:hypothetical protein J437_LFUL006738 [Ladona fulva]|uniref:Uncharacterized protein n=1 Tax=Ladona fulva TaxID=123851 RepID=A0A8K0K1V7_LADFU|nr:hypothetical protein J437_LFUL006738 [Ladona fulva]
MDYLWIAYLLLSFSTNFIDGSLQITKRSLQSERPPRFESFRECNRSFINNFSKVILKTICKPRPMPVDISPPFSNILVQQMDLLQHEAMPKCGVIRVEEHLRCKCKCTVMKEDCNEKQEYQAGECMCLCMNSEERRKCIQAGKTWDDEKCSCMCPIQKECTTPYVWLRDYCRCAKLMEEEEMRNEKN